MFVGGLFCFVFCVLIACGWVWFVVFGLFWLGSCLFCVGGFI